MWTIRLEIIRSVRVADRLAGGRTSYVDTACGRTSYVDTAQLGDRGRHGNCRSLFFSRKVLLWRQRKNEEKGLCSAMRRAVTRVRSKENRSA